MTDAIKMECRAKVLRFAWEMEKRLQANDHKDGWDTKTSKWLLNRMLIETGELVVALAQGKPEDITHKAADVANFAMFIADVRGDFGARY